MTPTEREAAIKSCAHLLIGSCRIDMLIPRRNTRLLDRNQQPLFDGDKVFALGIEKSPIIAQIRLIMPDSMTPYWGIVWRVDPCGICHTGIETSSSSEDFGVEKI